MTERYQLSDWGLMAAGIPTAVHYPVPLNLQPAYRDRCRVSISVELSESMARKVMSLPMGPDVTDSVLDKVISGLRCV